jgi:uroporphyrin-III C-methyltransferase / precorrin-2 dehydrogenase / sirohydrochlorin ferrochelatase
MSADGGASSMYPTGLRLTGRRVVVVGGGRAAHRCVAGLLEAGAAVNVVSPSTTPALEALAADGTIAWTPRHYRAGDLDGAWFALAATDDPSVNATVTQDAEGERIFCARPDDPIAGTASTIAVGRHGDLIDERIRARHSRSATDDTGLVTLVGGGPGDPGLITVRGQQAVAEADVVVVDHLAPQSLLGFLRPEVEVIDAAKLPRGRSMAQAAINALLVDRARAGRRVVRLKGGDPFVFGRGMEEVEACTDAGVPVEVIPGISSAIAVPALAGIPVTHRGMTHEFVVVSGHLPPGHPQSLVDWSAIGRLNGTVVVLMGVETAPAIAAALIHHGRRPGTPVAVVANGTTGRQRTVQTSLEKLGRTILDEKVRPPAVIIIGEVVRFRTAERRRRL